MTEPVRLGIIGASPQGSWASAAHLPAVQALDEIDLVAVATTRQESADAARAAYGAERAYGDPTNLLADPDIEAVTIAVKVPGHQDLVERALHAGKHVYCEWPLTQNTDTAVRLRDLAQESGLATIIGLQTPRSAPVRRAAEILSSGRLGDLLSVSLTISSPLGGPSLPQAHAYLADESNGANLLTITGGHALDTLCALAGEIETVVGSLSSRFPTVTIVETGETVPATSPDQVALTGTLSGGATFTAGIWGGLPYDSGFSLDVRCIAGGLRVVARPGLSGAALAVEQIEAGGQWTTVEVPATTHPLPGGPPSFVGMLYLDLVSAIRTGRSDGPDFAHAVRRHQLLDAIRDASRSGRVVSVPESRSAGEG